MKGLEFLESLPQWRQSGAFSPIEVPRKVLASLGNPQDKIKTIHVAGTNGKGTTCAAIASILKEAGEKTGFFSSPHLIDPTERCRINGQAISTEKFDYYLSKVAEIVDWNSQSMTYFVAVTAASFLCFVDEKVDYAVIEVGLGGKFDATNLIAKPQICVITNIDFDHVDVLGAKIKEIAENKAGIIKQNVPVVLGELSQEALDVVLSSAKEMQAEVFYLGREPIFIDNELMRSAIGQQASRIASKVTSLLGVGREDLFAGLKNLDWPGRMDFFEQQNILVDGAHNTAGIRVLFSHLEEMAGRKKESEISILLGLKQREGWKEAAMEVRNGIQNLKNKGLVVNLSLIKWEQGVENFDGFFNTAKEVELISALRKADGRELMVVCGSLYLIGEALTYLQRQ